MYNAMQEIMDSQDRKHPKVAPLTEKIIRLSAEQGATIDDLKIAIRRVDYYIDETIKNHKEELLSKSTSELLTSL